MFIVSAFPDESLFSRIVRQLMLSGLPLQSFLNTYFGKSRISIHPYLTIMPRHGEVSTTERDLKLIQEQTLGGLYYYFMPNRRDRVLNALVERDTEIITRECQLVTVKEYTRLTLKSCPYCARNDIQRFGVSYWHLSHQIPGIESCPYHQVWLVHTPLPTRSHIQYGLLPSADDVTTRSSKRSYQLACFASKQLHKIATDGGQYEHTSFHEKLNALGYKTFSNRIRRRLIMDSLSKLVSELSYKNKGLLPHSKEDYRYLSYYLDGNTSQHIFKYLLFNYWVGCDDIHLNRCSTIPRSQPKKGRNAAKESLCLEMLKANKSMVEISRITGKSPCYLKLLSARNDISVQSKPTKITYPVKSLIISMGSKGFHRKAIASKLNISVGSVEQVLSTVKGLVEKRKQGRFESRRRKYKVKLLRYLQAHPEALKQEVKMACYAEFHWLYLHEREWINLTLPKPTVPRLKAKVNWQNRDKYLSIKARNIMVLHKGNISRTQLDRLLGGHGWLIKYKDKLPQTLREFQQQNSSRMQ